MASGTGIIYKNILGRFLTLSVGLILFPGTLQHKQATAFISSFVKPSSPPVPIILPESDSIPAHTDFEMPVATKTPKEKAQASSTQHASTSKNAAKALPLIVSTQVQAENMLDQGYSVNDIAKELQLTKKEVRKLKKRLKKEEKAAVQQRKKDKKKNVSRNS